MKPHNDLGIHFEVVPSGMIVTPEKPPKNDTQD